MSSYFYISQGAIIRITQLPFVKEGAWSNSFCTLSKSGLSRQLHVQYNCHLLKDNIKKWVEGLSEEACYPRESPQKNQTKIGQLYNCQYYKVLIHRIQLNYKFFKIIENKPKLMSFFIFSIFRSKLTNLILNFSNQSISNQKSADIKLA